MRRVQLLLLGLALCPAGLAAQATVRLDPSDTTWEGDSDIWNRSPGSASAQNGEHASSLLWKEELVGDFVLEFEAYFQGEGSGVHFRASETGRFWASGYRFLFDEGLVEGGGRGLLAGLGEEVEWEGGERRVRSIDREAQVGPPLAGWHSYTLHAEGRNVSLFVDGELAAAFVDRDERHFSAAGVLGLRCGTESRVGFRMLRLTRLGDEPDAEAWSGRRNVRPEWLSLGRDAEPGDWGSFRKRFLLPDADEVVLSLETPVGADFEVWVNGALRARTQNAFAQEMPVEGLVPGQNTLIVTCRIPGRRPVVRAELEGFREGELVWHKASDASWRVARAGEEVWFFPRRVELAEEEMERARAVEAAKTYGKPSRPPAETLRLITELEELRLADRESVSDFLWNALRHRREGVREAARGALARVATKHWRDRALAERDPRTAFEALQVLMELDPEAGGDARLRERRAKLREALER